MWGKERWERFGQTGNGHINMTNVTDWFFGFFPCVTSDCHISLFFSRLLWCFICLVNPPFLVYFSPHVFHFGCPFALQSGRFPGRLLFYFALPSGSELCLFTGLWIYSFWILSVCWFLVLSSASIHPSSSAVPGLGHCEAVYPRCPSATLLGSSWGILRHSGARWDR